MRATFALFVGTVIVAATVAIASLSPVIPRCREDEVLVGAGDFDAGRYSAYVCGPAVDDFDPSL
jgi:hypothetical protein